MQQTNSTPLPFVCCGGQHGHTPTCTNSTPMTPEERAVRLRRKILPWDEYHYLATPGGELDQLDKALTEAFTEDQKRIEQLEAQLVEAQKDSDLVRSLNESQAQGMSKLWSIVAPGYEGDLTIHEYCRKLVSDLQTSLKAQDQFEHERDHYAALAAQRGDLLGKILSWYVPTENLTSYWNEQYRRDELATVPNPHYVEIQAALESTDAEQWLARQKAELIESIIETHGEDMPAPTAGEEHDVWINGLRTMATEIRKEAGIA